MEAVVKYCFHCTCLVITLHPAVKTAGLWSSITRCNGTFVCQYFVNALCILVGTIHLPFGMRNDEIDYCISCTEHCSFVFLFWKHKIMWTFQNEKGWFCKKGGVKIKSVGSDPYAHCKLSEYFYFSVRNAAMISVAFIAIFPIHLLMPCCKGSQYVGFRVGMSQSVFYLLRVTGHVKRKGNVYTRHGHVTR